MVRSPARALIGGMGLVLTAVTIQVQPASAQPATAQPIAEPATVPQEKPPASGIAVVDAQLVFQKSSAVQSIQQELDAQRAALTKIFGAQEESLRMAEQNLARQRLALDPATFETRRREFENKMAEARRTIQERTRKLDISFNEARDKVLRSINEVVAEIAREKGVGLVLRRDMVLYQAESIPDITEIVLQRLNAKLPQVKVALPD